MLCVLFGYIEYNIIIDTVYISRDYTHTLQAAAVLLRITNVYLLYMLN